MGIIINLEDRVFGRLTVLNYAGLHKQRLAKWLCKCECGNYVSVTSTNLVEGQTKSCGCLKFERIKSANLTHGQSKRDDKTSEYTAWANMKNRCYNESCKNYPDYGGRGISVCNEWLKSFESFFEYMGKKPSLSHSLDRFPDTNGNYEPGNVRWATKKEQANNVRTNKVVTYNGITKTLSEFRDELGFNYSLVLSRLSKGYSVDVSFETPSGHLEFDRKITQSSIEALIRSNQNRKKSVIQFDKNDIFINEFLSISEASEATGILRTAIKNCVNKRSKTAGGFKWKLNE